MRRRVTLFAVIGTITAAPCFAQQPSAIDRYLTNDAAVIQKSPREQTDVMGVLPQNRAGSFAEYIRVRFGSEYSLAALRQAVEHQRLNKLVGNSPTGAGTTSLLSKVAAPGAFGFAMEYGSITQKTTGNTTTLRANLLGIVNLVGGEEQFPSCPDTMSSTNCQPASRGLRRFSFSSSFESVAGGESESSGEESPTFTELFGGNFRLASWSARFDLTANDPDNPRYLAAWTKAVADLRTPEALALTQSLSALFANPEGLVFDAYVQWRAEAIPAIRTAAPEQFAAVMERQLDALVGRMAAADPEFWNKVISVRRAHDDFFNTRDAVLRAIQSQQASVEYVSQKPVDQPALSTLRLIYSHQPTARSAVLLTANAAVTWYTHNPTVVDAGGVVTDAKQLRDVQVAGQLDRRLGPGMRESVLTFGAYYQWMADDALIKFDPANNTAPGSGIGLTEAAQKVLTSKGHIGVAQIKLTIPISGALKLPASFTWSNRTELVTELEKTSVLKAQLGLTLDFDSMLKN